MTKEFFISEDLLGTHSLSPDGCWAVSIAPGESVRLYDTSGLMSYRVLEVTKTDRFGNLVTDENGELIKSPLSLVADAFAFNQTNGNGETTELALITENGLSITRIDLARRSVQEPFSINDALGLVQEISDSMGFVSESDLVTCTTIAYGPAETIFVGTTGGEVFLLTVGEAGELSLKKTLKVSDSGVVLLAPQFLVDGSVSLYTDDDELLAAHLQSDEIALIDRGDQSWLIESMNFHPELEVFVMWRSNGDIMLSTTEFGSLLLNFAPYGNDPAHVLKSVIVVDEQMILAVTSKAVVALRITYPASYHTTFEQSEADVEPFGDPELPLIEFRTLHEVRSGYRILAAVMPTTSLQDLTVLTTL
ncbi:hypothetical protein BH10CYA1_BH10CYA1_53660 [soil metagenome]